MAIERVLLDWQTCDKPTRMESFWVDVSNLHAATKTVFHEKVTQVYTRITWNLRQPLNVQMLVISWTKLLASRKEKPLMDPLKKSHTTPA